LTGDGDVLGRARANAELLFPFSSEDVLELDVTEKCLRFGDERRADCESIAVCAISSRIGL
jgi:hypothetical protein